MKSKYLSFAKNFGITAIVAVAVAAGVSELANYFTDDGQIIGTVSTIAQYVTSLGVFMPLHARDNKEIYEIGGKFNWKQFISDNLKFNAGLAILDVAYLIGRPFLQDYFINQGYTPSNSSFVTDVLVVGSYLTASFPVAKLSGIIKEKKN